MNSLKKISIPLLLSLIAGPITAQTSAAITNTCANDLSTSPNPTVGAMLSCLADMQRKIDRIDAAVQVQKPLSEADIEAIASEMDKKYVQARQILAPPGMVAAFNLSECPDGWAQFVTDDGKTAAGRFIVGTGEQYPLTTVGGSSTHVLSPSEIPGHQHTYIDVFYSANPGQGQGVPEIDVPKGIGDQGKAANTNNKGIYATRSTNLDSRVANAHQNMPPYISLLYCEVR